MKHVWIALAWLLSLTAPAVSQVQSLAQMQPAAPVSDTDTFFWCQWPQSPGSGCDNNPAHPLVRGNAAALATYVLAKGGIGLTVPSAQLLGGNGSALLGVSVGSGLSLSGGVLSATGGGGGGGLTAPNAPLTSGNGTVLGSVTLGTNLSLSGTFPNQTLNASGGGGGGGGGNLYVGTITGGPTAYAMASPSPAHTTDTAYDVVCGTVAAANTGAATLQVGGGAAIAINKQNISSATVTLAQGDIQGSANTICFQLNAGKTAWVMFTLSSPAAPIPNAATHTVTAAEWQSGQTFLYTNPAGGFTLNFPSATTLGAGTVYIITRGTGVSLVPAATDGINALAINTPLAVPDGLNTTVLTTGAAGAGAFQVPLGTTLKADLSWIAGQNLGSCANVATTGCMVPIFNVGQPVILKGASCNIMLAAGGTASFDFAYVPDGSTTMTVINSGSPACNANAAAGTATAATLTTTVIPANSTIGLKVLQSWSSVLGSGLAEIGYNRD